MASSVFFAVASAVLFGLVFQNGGATSTILERITEIAQNEADIKNDSLALVDVERGRTNVAVYLIKTSRHSGGKISCVTSLTRDDYTVVPGVGAYKFHKRAMTWNDARKICMAEGAQLAVLDSQAKEKAIQDGKEKNDVDSVWIGYHDLFEEGAWVTVTGESVDTLGYHGWGPSEPNNVGRGEDCAVLGGSINDIPCASQKQFVCEINLCETCGPAMPNLGSSPILS